MKLPTGALKTSPHSFNPSLPPSLTPSSSSLTLNDTTITGANMTAAVLVDDGMVSARDFLVQSTAVGLQTTGSNSTAFLSGGTLNAASWGLSAYVSSTIIGDRLQIATSAIPRQ